MKWRILRLGPAMNPTYLLQRQLTNGVYTTQHSCDNLAEAKDTLRAAEVKLRNDPGNYFVVEEREVI